VILLSISGVTLVWEVGDQAQAAPRIKTPKASREVKNGEGILLPQRTMGLGSIECSPTGVRGILELSKHVWHMLQILVSHAGTLSLASSFNMCNKLNSVYRAFRIWVNYITVCTLHFCITRFEGKNFWLDRLVKWGRSIPHSIMGGRTTFPL